MCWFNAALAFQPQLTALIVSADQWFSFASAAFLFHSSKSDQTIRWERPVVGNRHASASGRCVTHCAAPEDHGFSDCDTEPGTAAFLPDW
jgi:hypothetical protein